MPQNPIYDFLKANNLTDKDEATFLSEYADSSKAKELHQFFQENNLTDKDFNSFYSEYLKKKDGGTPSPASAKTSFNGVKEAIAGASPLPSALNPVAPSYQPKTQTTQKPKQQPQGSEDPIGDLLKPINQQIQQRQQQVLNTKDNTFVQKNPVLQAEVESPYTELRNLQDQKLDVEENAITDTDEARNIVTVLEQRHGKLKPGVNQTYDLAQQRIIQREKRDAVINQAPDLKTAALNFITQTDPQAAKEITAMGGNISQSYVGHKLGTFLNDPYVRERAEKDPKFKAYYDEARTNFTKNFPDLGISFVSNKLSQMREDEDGNSWWFNTPSDEWIDKALDKAHALPEDSPYHISDDEYKLAKSRKKDLFIKTTGLVNNLVEGFDGAMNKAVKGLIGLAKKDIDRNPVKDLSLPQKEYSEVVEKDATAVNVMPKGLLHEMTKEGGNFTGSIVPMIFLSKGLGAAGVPASIASGMAGVISFYQDHHEQALRRFPGDPDKQDAYKIAMAAGDYLLGQNLLPKSLTTARSALQENVGKAVAEATQKNVSRAAAREMVEKSILNTVKEYGGKIPAFVAATAKHNLKTTATLTGFNMYGMVMDSLFGGERKGEGDQFRNLYESAKSTFISAPILSAFAAGADISPAAKMGATEIWDIASNPQKYKEIYKTLPNGHELLKSVEDAAAMKADIEAQWGELPTEKKAAILLQDLNRKMLEEKLKTVSSPSRQDKIRQQIKRSKEFAETIRGERELNLSKPKEGEVAYYDDKKNIPVLAEKMIKGETLTDEDIKLQENFPSQLEAELQGLAEKENPTVTEPPVENTGTADVPRETEGVSQEGKVQPKIIQYEDTFKQESDVSMEGLPEGTDEHSREVRSQMIRDRQAAPPAYEKHEIGTYAVDKYGEAYQLQEVPLEKIVTKEEGTQRPETVEKYAKWQEETGDMKPIRGVENYAVHDGKVVVLDGNHRVLAAKKNGRETIPVWVALTDPANHARPLMEKDIPSHFENQNKPNETTPNPKAEAAQNTLPELSNVEEVGRVSEVNAEGEVSSEPVTKTLKYYEEKIGRGEALTPEETTDYIKLVQGGSPETKPVSLNNPKDLPIFRGASSEEHKEGFYSLDKGSAEGYAGKDGKVLEGTIKEGSTVLNLVKGDTDNYKPNKQGVSEFQKITGDKAATEDITERLWNEPETVQKLKDAGVDIVIGNTIDGPAVFVVNKEAVEYKGNQKPVTREQPYQTKSGKYRVEYRDGKRVVVDQDGNVMPETKYVKQILRDHDKQYQYNFGEKADPSKAPQFGSEEEAARWTIENSNNPAEVAEVYHHTEKESHPLSAVEQAIADHNIGKVTEESYRRYGDENNINNAKARAYFSNKGESIDVIAEQASNLSGIEVTPEDVVAFIDRFPNGVESAVAKRDGEIRLAAADKFKQLTGIDLTDRVARQAALQNLEPEVRAQAQVNAEHLIETEPLPENEVATWLQEEADKTFENSETFDNLDTYGEDTANPSTENRGEPQTQSADGSHTTKPQEISTSEGVRQPGTAGGEETPGQKEVGQQDWTPIRNAEITSAEDLAQKGYRLGGTEPSTETVRKGMEKLEGERKEGQSLYDTANQKVEALSESIKAQLDSDGKVTTALNDEEFAQLMYHRAATQQRMAELADKITSPIESERIAAFNEFDLLQENLAKVDFVLRGVKSVSARAMRFMQNEGMLDPDHGLQIRRMEVAGRKGRELTEAEEETIAKIWEEEKAIIEEKHKAQVDALKEEFDQRLKDEVARRVKSVTKGQSRSLKLTGKSVADKIRKLKTAPADRGLQSNILGFAEPMYNVLIEGIAKLVEGGATVAEAIKTLIDKGQAKFNDADHQREFTAHIREAIGEPSPGDRIADIAANTNAKSITMDMVKKGLIQDLLFEQLDKGLRPEEVLDAALSELQQYLPDTTENQLREAYLKEGEFKLPTKAELNKQRKLDIAELTSISKLKTDIDMLRAEQELRKRGNYQERERSEYEKGLIDERKKLIDERKEVVAKEINPKIKAKRLAELDERIATVDNQSKMWKRNRLKTNQEIDKDINAKQKELQKKLNDKGIRTDRNSLYARARKGEVLNAHNERVDEALKNIEDTLNDGELSPEDKGAVQGVKTLLEKAKLDTSTVERVDDLMDKAKRTLQSIVDTKSKAGSVKDVQKVAKKLIRELDKDRHNSQLDVAVDARLRRLKSGIDSTTNDINGERYDDHQTLDVRRNKKVVAIEIAHNKVKAKYNLAKEQHDRKDHSWLKKGARVLQATYVNELIGGIGTVLTVTGSGIIKQPLETITRSTVGQLTKRLFPHLASRAGAEGFSLRQEQHRYMAHYAAIGEKGMQERVAKSAEKLKAAEKAFYEADRKTPDGIRYHDENGKPVYDKAWIKARNERDEATLDHLANGLYEWIGSNAWSDAGNAFVHGVTNIEQALGKAVREDFKDMDGVARYEYIIGFMGTLHGTIKNFSARAEFAASFVARLENKLKRGVDIRDGEELILTAVESFQNYLMGKYQEANFVTDAFNTITKAIKEMGERNPKYKFYADITSDAARVKHPIMRTPVNILKDAVLEYTFGIPRAIALHAFYEGKGVVEALKGIKDNEIEWRDFRKSLREGIDKLDQDQVDLIFRTYRKGAIGLAMWALASYGLISYGGFFTPGRKKDEKEGQFFVNGKPVGKTVSKILDHLPLFMMVKLQSNYQKVAKEQEFKGEDGKSEAIKSDLMGMLHSLPITQDFQNPLNRPSLPYGRINADIQKWRDTDEDGNLIDRKAETGLDAWKLGLGIDRKSVPEADPKGKARQKIREMIKAGTRYSTIPKELKDKAAISPSSLKEFVADAHLEDEEVTFKNMKSESQYKSWQKMNEAQKQKFAPFLHHTDKFKALPGVDNKVLEDMRNYKRHIKRGRH